MLIWESNLTGCPILYLVTRDGKPPVGCSGGVVWLVCVREKHQLDFLAEWFSCYFSESQQQEHPSWLTVLITEWFPGVPLSFLQILTWAAYLLLSPGSQPKCGSWETHPSPPTKAPVAALSLCGPRAPLFPLAEHLGHMLQLLLLCLRRWSRNPVRAQTVFFSCWFFCI